MANIARPSSPANASAKRSLAVSDSLRVRAPRRSQPRGMPVYPWEWASLTLQVPFTSVPSVGSRRLRGNLPCIPFREAPPRTG